MPNVETIIKDKAERQYVLIGVMTHHFEKQTVINESRNCSKVLYKGAEEQIVKATVATIQYSVNTM